MEHDPNYLPTGSPTLNSLLAIEADNKDDMGGGILVEGVSPIVLIEGAAGTGKTLLALQIAHAISQATKPDSKHSYRVFFYSLEQPAESLKSAAKNYEFDFKDKKSLFCDLKEATNPPDFNSEDGRVYLCHLTQLSINQRESTDDFEERFNLLQHMVTTADNEFKKNHRSWRPVFFIDSLNAFTTSPVGRHEIYRLFQLFRNSDVPAFFTAEWYDAADPQRKTSTDAARFLCDIGIHLDKDTKHGYQQMYLEISKSRVGRQAFGRHLYKIRDAEFSNLLEKAGYKSHAGIVVYPSIHSVLSSARSYAPILSDKEEEDYLISGPAGDKNKDIRLIMRNDRVKTGACFAVLGATGTHKLALAMNLATGILQDKYGKRSALDDNIGSLSRGKLLIVKFGGSGEINFKGVAWFEEREEWKNLELGPLDPNLQKIKWWTVEYGKYQNVEENKEIKRTRVIGEPAVDVLTFHLRDLTPEECLDVIEKKIFNEQERVPKYSAVLLSDTASLCTGFPALRADPVFLPTLLELFKTNQIVSVCIGVAGGGDVSSEVDFGLSARADYRISLSHCPDTNYLMEKIYNDEFREKTKMKHEIDIKPEDIAYSKLQKISLVIDNVMGKDYSRVPLWLRVVPTGDTKQLMCERWPKESPETETPAPTVEP
jgi:KaiC/GvpD/RAD55 family RecA-like ATPase